ncbi:MAG: hypothetical protein WAL85_15385 [Candidatus Korobacteraceae bacterium]
MKWKLALVVPLLLLFFCVGVAHVINPDLFIKRSGIRRGGELLTDWNRLQFQIGGLIFAGFSAYLLYIVCRTLLFSR